MYRGDIFLSFCYFNTFPPSLSPALSPSLSFSLDHSLYSSSCISLILSLFVSLFYSVSLLPSFYPHPLFPLILFSFSIHILTSLFSLLGGRGSSAVERATPGEEVLGSIPAVAARSLQVGSVSV